LRLERTETDLDRKFAAVFSEPEELEAGPHRPQFGIRKIAGPVFGMLFPKTLGDEQFDPLPNELVARISKKALRLRVDEVDASVAPHDDHGVGRRLEESFELLLRLLSLGNIPNCARNEGSVLGLERAQADLDR